MLDDRPVSRRAFLGAGAALALAGLGAASCGGGSGASRAVRAGRLRPAGSLPLPHRPAGEHALPQLEHIVVVMMENHTFDNVLGMLPHQLSSSRRIDGLPVSRTGEPLSVNLDAEGRPVRAHHAATVCLPARISQTWKASHLAWDGGRNDGFVRATSADAMAYFDRGDLPFTYSLAGAFPIGQRYFSSVLAQTYPNRRFLFAGTASGTIDDAFVDVRPANGTIFDRLDAHGVSWKTYYSDAPTMVIIPGTITDARRPSVVKVEEYYADAAAGRLPAVCFVEPDYDVSSEENPQDIQYGDQFVERVVRALIASPNWPTSALVLTYDEGGGYYDHVPPPAAVKPDDIPPRLGPGDPPGGYDVYGFRVPLVMVSPYGRPGYVSSIVQDHTSILALIERTWNLPSLTRRDANAADLTDYLDLARRPLLHPPRLTPAAPIGPGLTACHAAGEFPKQPSS